MEGPERYELRLYIDFSSTLGAGLVRSQASYQSNGLGSSSKIASFAGETDSVACETASPGTPRFVPGDPLSSGVRAEISISTQLSDSAVSEGEMCKLGKVG